ARATSTATPATRLISSGVTSGLLAKPHTPLWMTRTPNPYVSVASPPPNPPPPRRISPLRTPIDCARLRVNRMSAYEQPRRFASPSAMVDHSRYLGSRTGGACSRCGSNVRAPAHRGALEAMAPAASDWRKRRRLGLMKMEYKGPSGNKCANYGWRGARPAGARRAPTRRMDRENKAAPPRG